MSNELQVIETDVLTVEEKTTLSTEIDRIIAAHKDNRQDINRLVFESVAAMTTADEAASELSSKGFFRRLIGGLSGDNQRLQNKINSNRAAAQYAYQQTLQRLAEQNLMTFDLITAVNNKLNASMVAVGEEFQRIYEGLGKFLQHNRGELVRLETRLDKVERNVNLLTWQNTIKFLTFNGCVYAKLDDASKIVCLTRDFYEITKGDWTTSDLLLLMEAMTKIDIQPEDRVNYFSALKEIAGNPVLTEKLLGNREIKPLDDPTYLIAFGTLKKLDSLQGDEAYIVRTITDYLTKSNVASDEEHIRTDLTAEYMRENAGVRLDTEIECYDLILDLLFNLQQAESEDLLKLPASAIKAQLHEAERFYLAYEHEKAFPIFEALAEAGNGRAMYFLGEYYDNGCYVTMDKEESNRWRERSAKEENVLAKLNIAYNLPEHTEEQVKRIREVLPSLRELARQGDLFAMTELAGALWFYENDKQEARRLYESAAQKGYWLAMHNLGGMYTQEGDHKKANSWFKKAGSIGFDASWYELGLNYKNGCGVTQDNDKAIKYLEKAYNLHGSSAGVSAFFIGRILFSQKKYIAANDWYKKSGEAGFGRGWNRLGISYKQGDGVVIDEDLAIACFKKAYDLNGDVAGEAANNIGNILYNNRNYEEAAIWFRKSGESGCDFGWVNLGYRYEEGKGVTRDKSEARECFLRARDMHGNAEAEACRALDQLNRS